MIRYRIRNGRPVDISIISQYTVQNLQISCTTNFILADNLVPHVMPRVARLLILENTSGKQGH
jgi:hypothetical protein